MALLVCHNMNNSIQGNFVFHDKNYSFELMKLMFLVVYITEVFSNNDVKGSLKHLTLKSRKTQGSLARSKTSLFHAPPLQTKHLLVCRSTTH